MNVTLANVIRGDRFIGSDGRDWTVLANDGTTVTAIDLDGTKRKVPAGPFVVGVTNRDDDIDDAQAIVNLQQAGLNPRVEGIE